VVPRIAVVLIILVVAGCRAGSSESGAARQPSGVSVIVDVAAEQGMLNTQLSTNLILPNVLERAPGARSLLSNWAPPLVRLHAAADEGDLTLMPAGGRQGDWNFAPLDSLAEAVRAYGGEPVVNIRYAPNWMWTCSRVFDRGREGVGSLRDPSYNEFAEYMARVVGWYNKGGFTDERGVVHQSTHQGWVRYWEIWNEPDLSDETPCHPAGGGPALTPDQYAAMWNVVVPKMLAVDPTLKLVGPAISGPAPEYMPTLMQRAQRPPDVLSYHLYGGGDNADTDQTLFNGLASGVVAADPRWNRPIWVTEMNVNSAYETEDAHGRPSGPFGVAWGASAFRALALAGVALVHQYDFVDELQFGLVDAQTGRTRLPYWRDVLLSRAFPAGSRVVRSTSSVAGVETLAARRPDGALSVLVVNRSARAAGETGGNGASATVSVQLQGATPTAIGLRQLDRTSDPSREPPPVSVPPTTDLRFSSSGYGIALFEINTSPAVAAVSTPMPAPTPGGSPPTPAPAVAHDDRYFPQTQFRIDNDGIWQYFSTRGRERAFGFPVSRTFVFLGCSVQIFQRHVAQICDGSQVGLLNILDADLLPYTRINGSAFPSIDEALKNRAPDVKALNYASAVVDFVRSNAPDEFGGQPTRFGQTFFETVPADQAGTQDRGILDLLNLELWGVPLSGPTPDPSNADFIYQRFQRGIMHYSVSGGATRGVLVADYLKQLLRNSVELPEDLRQQARTSKFFAQYCPGAAKALCRPDELPATDLTFAFEIG
jgi:hypothetical protein